MVRLMAESSRTSFLGLEGLHVFVTGAAGGIGGEAVREFLNNGCRVTAHDRRPILNITSSTTSYDINTPAARTHLHTVQGDLTSEASVAEAIEEAHSHFGPINILVANAGITDESNNYPIWELPIDLWDRTYATNVRGTFLTIKHFLQAAKLSQDESKKELDNLAIVVTGSECGKFGQAGHSEYASGKAGLMYGLIRSVKNEIVTLNGKARINAVAPGWVDTPLIEGRLDDPREMWAEAQATVPLKKIAKHQDVARAMVFLASHRAAGHISGECISVDGGMEGRLIWKEADVVKSLSAQSMQAGKEKANTITTSIPTSLSTPIPPQSSTKRRKISIAITIDFDAVSGYLGTGQHPSNGLSDYSAGLFSARGGLPRLLKLFKKYDIADKVTWFIPGHSMESFPAETKAIVDSGCEVALHGYSHEGAYEMTPAQERDVLAKCIGLATNLTGKKPTGYRAPLYQIRESTIALLREHCFSYDSSLNAHDSLPYFLPDPLPPPPHVPDFSQSAVSWMHPLPTPQFGSATDKSALVEIPTSWYTEDMTPLAFYPYTPNSQGYVDVKVVEGMWWDRWDWLWENESDIDDPSFGGSPAIFPLVFHPETAGRAHVVGMIERLIKGLVGKVDEGFGGIRFERMGDVARIWRENELRKAAQDKVG